MKIYNETKTQELNENEIDREKGALKYDKLFIKHHEAVPFKQGKTAHEIADELAAQGVIIEIGYDEIPYRVVEEHEGGGRTGEEIKAELDTPAQEAYDEYEDIQVYVPYTEPPS